MRFHIHLWTLTVLAVPILFCFRLYERGHEVVGAEIAEPPVKELFEENNIEYDIENFSNVGNLYKVCAFCDK